MWYSCDGWSGVDGIKNSKKARDSSSKKQWRAGPFCSCYYPPLEKIVSESIKCIASKLLVCLPHAVAPNNCTTNGEIRLIGLNTTCILSGKVHLCYKNEWRTVCHYRWNEDDVQVVCRQLGLPEQGNKTIIMIATNSSILFYNRSSSMWTLMLWKKWHS